MLIENSAEMFNDQMSSQTQYHFGQVSPKFPPAHQLNNCEFDWQAGRWCVSAPGAVRYI